MKQFSLKLILFITFLILSLTSIQNASSEQVNELKNDDRFLGNIDAPITVIEYASLSCPHCAAFHLEILPIIKKEYIDNDKVRLIFRDFPLNLPAFEASMILRCVDKELYFKYLDALFKLQKKWALPKGSRESLFNILQNSGMTQNEFDNCLDDNELKDKIYNNQLKAHKEFNMQTTPSFIINGKLLQGSKSIDTFRKIFDDILSNKT